MCGVSILLRPRDLADVARRGGGAFNCTCSFKAEKSTQQPTNNKQTTVTYQLPVSPPDTIKPETLLTATIYITI